MLTARSASRGRPGGSGRCAGGGGGSPAAARLRAGLCRRALSATCIVLRMRGGHRVCLTSRPALHPRELPCSHRSLRSIGAACRNSALRTNEAVWAALPPCTGHQVQVCMLDLARTLPTIEGPCDCTVLVAPACSCFFACGPSRRAAPSAGQSPSRPGSGSSTRSLSPT